MRNIFFGVFLSVRCAHTHICNSERISHWKTWIDSTHRLARKRRKTHVKRIHARTHSKWNRAPFQPFGFYPCVFVCASSFKVTIFHQFILPLLLPFSLFTLCWCVFVHDINIIINHISVYQELAKIFQFIFHRIIIS